MKDKTTDDRKIIYEESHSGFLTGTDIKSLLDKEIVIHPYTEENLTPVGYNFTFSDFIYSLFTRTFVEIVNNKKEPEHFWIRPNETVLVLTREMIWVSKHIGGTFHSKVSLVVEGLSHVSTTLDPGWQGQLLVPITNPTKKSIKVYTQKKNKEIQSFITLVLHRSVIATYINDDNPPARLDLLMEIVKKDKPSKKRTKFIEVLENIQNSIYGSADKHGNRQPHIDLNKPAIIVEDEIIKCKNCYDIYNDSMLTEANKKAILNFKKSQNRRRMIKSTIIIASITLLLSTFAFISIKSEGLLGEIIKLILIPCFGILSTVITDLFRRKIIK